MQVVIEIPEEDYNFIKEVDESNYFVTINLYTAVYEGIILPKGHGRLIDVKNVRVKPQYMQDVMGCAMIRCEDLTRILADAPTIIEADESEVKE